MVSASKSADMPARNDGIQEARDAKIPTEFCGRETAAGPRIMTIVLRVVDNINCTSLIRRRIAGVRQNQPLKHNDGCRQGSWRTTLNLPQSPQSLLQFRNPNLFFRDHLWQLRRLPIWKSADAWCRRAVTRPLSHRFDTCHLNLSGLFGFCP